MYSVMGLISSSRIKDQNFEFKTAMKYTIPQLLIVILGEVVRSDPTTALKIYDFC